VKHGDDEKIQENNNKAIVGHPRSNPVVQAAAGDVSVATVADELSHEGEGSGGDENEDQAEHGATTVETEITLNGQGTHVIVGDRQVSTHPAVARVPCL
jgi:hypothetical protein